MFVSDEKFINVSNSSENRSDYPYVNKTNEISEL